MALNPANDDLRRDDLANDGLMHENTFNDALARALARQCRQWRGRPRSVIAQRTGVIRDNPRLWPDIIVNSDDAYPVIIENDPTRPPPFPPHPAPIPVERKV